VPVRHPRSVGASGFEAVGYADCRQNDLEEILSSGGAFPGGVVEHRGLQQRGRYEPLAPFEQFVDFRRVHLQWLYAFGHMEFSATATDHQVRTHIVGWQQEGDTLKFLASDQQVVHTRREGPQQPWADR